jgi:DNA (cytosine-5)-methyltransferase 1
MLPPLPERLRLGSLFTGYGGLDMAIMHVLNTRLTWTCDNAAGPCAIIARRFGGVPNLIDVRDAVRSATPVDVLSCGFPCQDVSEAGRRAGNTGQRTRLYTYAVDVIDRVRPGLVVAENVRGILNARGSTLDRPAFGDVLTELSGIGYDAAWATVSASSVGAPHRRDRIFVLAWPVASDPGGETIDVRSGFSAGPPPEQWRGRPVHDAGPADAGHATDAQPRQVAWGPYEPAVRRWERITGRPAPYPVEDTGRGGWKLTPPYVEWMMGLAPGWVTDVDLSRTEKLRALGNGVVPQQAVAALEALMHALPATALSRLTGVETGAVA